jgi:hypothetical protein
MVKAISRVDCNRGRTENVYIGMACTSHFSERIGKYFFKITNTYEDAEVVVSPTLG